MTDTQNTQNNGTGTETQETRTLTQEELDAIVENRLRREREKYKDYDALKEKAGKYDEIQDSGKTELQKAAEKIAALQGQVDAYTKAESLRGIREKVSKETGVPASLLSGEDEATCKAQAQAIQEYAKPGSSKQTIKDGGEPQNKPSGATRDQFADWFSQALK